MREQRADLVFHLISAHGVSQPGRVSPTYVAACGARVKVPGCSEVTQCPHECECEFSPRMAYCDECVSVAIGQNHGAGVEVDRRAGVEVECSSAVSGAQTLLVGDFIIASRLFAGDEPEAALGCLLPVGESLERRVAALVRAGALVTGTLTAVAHAEPGTVAGGVRAARVAGAGARREGRVIRELIAARSGAGAAVEEALVEALVELMIGFAVLEGRRAGPR